MSGTELRFWKVWNSTVCDTLSAWAISSTPKDLPVTRRKLPSKRPRLLRLTDALISWPWLAFMSGTELRFWKVWNSTVCESLFARAISTSPKGLPVTTVYRPS